MSTKKYKKIFFYLIITLIIFLTDRLTKIYILDLAGKNQLVDVYITNFLNIYLIWNKGVSFGLLSTESEFFYNSINFLIISINIFIFIMILRAEDYKKFFLLLILGGSLGNLFDRLYYQAVPDFIDFHINNFHWFVFNVADIFISIGIICLILDEIFFNKQLKNNEKN
jgi:signal peptidase II